MTKHFILAILLGTTNLAGTVFGQDTVSVLRDTAALDMKQALMLRPVVVPAIGMLPANHFILNVGDRLWLASLGYGLGNGWETEVVVHNKYNPDYRAVQPILRYRWPVDRSVSACFFGGVSYSHPIRNGERRADLSLGYAHRLNDTYRLFADITGGYPASIAIGGGFNRHTGRTVTDLGLAVRANRDRGVPIDIRFGFRVRLWRAIFLELRDRITYATRTTTSQWPVRDQYGNIVRYEEHRETDERIDQDQVGCLGIAF